MPVAVRTARRLVGLVAVTVVAFAVVGCSDDDEEAATTTVDTAEAYCDAWSGLVDAFEAYDEIDVVDRGLDSVRSYFDDLEAAADELANAADEQLREEVGAFRSSLDDLVTAITSTSLPVDRRDQVRDAAAEVDAAWNDLVPAFDAGCPSITADTVAA